MYNNALGGIYLGEGRDIFETPSKPNKTKQNNTKRVKHETIPNNTLYIYICIYIYIYATKFD